MTHTKFSLGKLSRGIRRTVATGILLFAAAASAQQVYPTPDAAVAAFIDGISRHDWDQIRVVLGADWNKFVPTRTVDGDDVTNFLAAWATAHRIVPSGDTRAFLEVGKKGWTLPIPLEKTAAGWRFDTRSTPDELRTRRIGRNELNVIQVVLALGDAQEDFAKNDRDRDGFKQYAQKIISSPGKHDGLYWPTQDDEPPSPLGPIAAATTPGAAYHGYYYRILTGQGKDAPGGAKSYVKSGHMTGGYAVVAWPATWGDTGVMTFIADKDGAVYQKNLGAKTDSIAREMKVYDPDSSWTKVK